jgi:RimJ/RimL family protein N-acetyltransferase
VNDVLRAPDVLETPRLVLRHWEPADREAMRRINRDPRVMRFLSDPMGTPFDDGQTDAFLETLRSHWDEHGYGLYAAAIMGPEECIGYVGLSVPVFLPGVLPAVEIGWRLDSRFWNQGLATEGARACLPVAFGALGLERLVSIGHRDNIASLRVMAKIGMRPIAEMVHPSRGWPLAVYELRRGDWAPTE